MPLTRGTAIGATDLAALATAANTNLLPLVNAAILASTWPGHAYDKYSSGSFFTSGTLTYPQPNYSFSTSSKNWMSELNRIRADYWTLIFNSGLGAHDIFEADENILSGPWIVGVNDPTNFPLVFGRQPLPDEPGEPVYESTSSPFSAQGQLFGTMPTNGFASSPGPTFTIFKTVQFLYALTDALNGITISTSRRVDGFINSELIGSSVELAYTANAAGQLQAVLKFGFNGTGLPPASAFSPSASPSTGVTFSTEINSSNTITADFCLVVTINTALTAGTGTITITASSAGGYSAVGMGTNTFGYLSTASLVFSTASGPIKIVGLHPSSDVMMISCYDTPDDSDFIVNDAYAVAAWQISNPTVQGVWVAKTLPIPALNTFLDADLPPYVGSILPPQVLAGGFVVASPIAVSATLELAEYLDNPPTNQPSNDDPTLTSSMRQQGLFQHGNKTEVIDGYTIILGAKYNLIKQSEQCQPAQWLVRRDTDVVPSNLGYNPNDIEYITPNITASKNGSLSYFTVNAATLLNAKSLKVRLVQAGTAAKAWKNGILQYGTALSENLNIYASKSALPTTSSYDFMTVNNAVTIPTDGGSGYLAEILTDGVNFAVQNPNGVSDVTFDLIVEVDTAINPNRQYFPEANECFSYFLDGTPPAITANYSGPNVYSGHYPYLDSYAVGFKPIPQNGYCIFKIRATRLPKKNSAGISVTPTSGDQINITLGQNRLQLDGTMTFAPFASVQPIIGAGDAGTIGGGDTGTIGAGGVGQIFTITIPANARDSGDISVFWPVIGGNELVYQCSEQIILEAWANWQPIFFAGIYSTYGLTYSTYIGLFDPNPVEFQYCLGFTNFFNPYQANLPDLYGGEDGAESAATTVHFLPSIEIVNDLTNCLNLLT